MTPCTYSEVYKGNRWTDVKKINTMKLSCYDSKNFVLDVDIFMLISKQLFVYTAMKLMVVQFTPYLNQQTLHQTVCAATTMYNIRMFTISIYNTFISFNHQQIVHNWSLLQLTVLQDLEIMTVFILK